MNYTEQLIDKMIAQGYEFGLDYDVDNKWSAVFCSPDIEHYEEESKGDTMEEAVQAAYDDKLKRVRISSSSDHIIGSFNFMPPLLAIGAASRKGYVPYTQHITSGAGYIEMTSELQEYINKARECIKLIPPSEIKPQGITSPIARTVLKEYRTEWSDSTGALPTPQCDHEYRQYVGLTKQFDYCVKCDEKKE